MKEIVYDCAFEQPKGNAIGSQLKEVIDFLQFIKENPKAKKLAINLSEIRFVHPMFILSIAALADQLQHKGYQIYLVNPKKPDCTKYIKKIYYPKGLKPDEMGNWFSVLNRYKGKTYLPIINFSTNNGPIQTTVREKVLSKVNRLIKSNLQLDVSYEEAVSYLISEITDNVVEHSGKDRGWILIQYYKTTQYLDICIIDTGKTILGSYRDHGFLDVKNDEQALNSALKGISTKSNERGTGIRTSKAISSLGLQGDFAIYSGNALYYKNKIVDLPVSWIGTFVAMRIKGGIQNFSIYSYV